MQYRKEICSIREKFATVEEKSVNLGGLYCSATVTERDKHFEWLGGQTADDISITAVFTVKRPSPGSEVAAPF